VAHAALSRRGGHQPACASARLRVCATGRAPRHEWGPAHPVAGERQAAGAPEGSPPLVRCRGPRLCRARHRAPTTDRHRRGPGGKHAAWRHGRRHGLARERARRHSGHPVAQHDPGAPSAGASEHDPVLAALQAAATPHVAGARHDQAARPSGRSATRRDATHQATPAIAAAFPGATCDVGEPCNAAAQRTVRVHAQQVSTACTACTRKLIQQLADKTAGARAINDASSSQTCPVCGERSHHRRISRCPHCGATGPREAVGAVQILALGHQGALLPGRCLPPQVT